MQKNRDEDLKMRDEKEIKDRHDELMANMVTALEEKTFWTYTDMNREMKVLEWVLNERK